MGNRKLFLIIKAALILLFTVYVLAVPTTDIFRKWLRFGMLIFFVVTFIIDLNRVQKK